MEAVKEQLKKMYALLGIMYVIGLICFILFQRSFILSFSFGTFVSAVNFYLTFWAFNKMYKTEEGKAAGLLVGPLPKLGLIILGSILCYKLPDILPVLPFLIGVCLYPIAYLLLGAVDFLLNKKG